MTKLGFIKASFEKIKITIKITGKHFFPLKTALRLTVHQECVPLMGEKRHIAPDFTCLFSFFQQGRVWTLEFWVQNFQARESRFEGFCYFFFFQGEINPEKNSPPWPSFYSEAQHLEMLKNTQSKYHVFSNQGAKRWSLNSFSFCTKYLLHSPIIRLPKSKSPLFHFINSTNRIQKDLSDWRR